VIIPDVVVSEKHSDTLEITEHPVETGRQFPITPISAQRSRHGGWFAGGGALLDFASN
jgi:hypothetical protein